jgi:hypothetical protein
VQPVARLLLDIRWICPLLLGFLQRSDLLLLTGNAAVQRRNLRPLTEQLAQRCSECESECGNNNSEHRSASGKRGLGTARRIAVSVNARRSTVLCGRTAAGQRQPTTNRGNAEAPA